MDLKDMLTKSLTVQDRGRERSKQTAVGPSAVGGCRRRVWHTLAQTPTTNHDTDHLAAIMGTLIHDGIAKAIKREDPFGNNFLIEQRFATDRITGNVDLFIKDRGIVVDWKTTTKKSLRYFPSTQQRYQVHIYGWLLEQHGHTVNEVALVAIPRDGNSDDIKVFQEPYDRGLAEYGLEWLAELERMFASGEPAPNPEMKVPFCQRYCQYFDPTGEVGCPSLSR